MKKGIPELENQPMEDLLDRIEELHTKIETGLLKHLTKRNKFAEHPIPTFTYGAKDNEPAPQAN